MIDDDIKPLDVKPMIEKYRKGDSLSDFELYRLVDFYEQAEWILLNLGEEFTLAWRPVSYDLIQLKRFMRARERDKINSKNVDLNDYDLQRLHNSQI